MHQTRPIIAMQHYAAFNEHSAILDAGRAGVEDLPGSDLQLT